MTTQEKRLVLSVCVVLAAATTSTASFNYVVLPMMESLHATQTQQSLLRQLPSIGALLVIFMAGVLGPRIGPRRFIVSCGLLMMLGYTIVLASPAMALTSLGMLLGSIGQQGLLVVAIGLLSAGLTRPESRASGFASLAMVTPLVYLIATVTAAACVGLIGWRAVIGLWVVAAAAATICAKRLLPADPGGRPSRVELWTPGLAGFTLACIVQAVNNVARVGWTGRSTLVWFALALVAATVLVVLMRRLARPSLDISVLRHGGFRLLLVVVLLVPFASMAFYAMVGAQFVYGYGEFQTSLIMVPAQVASLAGAVLSGRLIKRRGLKATGTGALLVMSLAMFLATTQTVTQPVLLSLAIVCLYSLAMTATNAPLTNAIMNLAAKGSEGSAAAFRGASANLGSAVGVVIISTIVFSTFESSLATQIRASGGDVSQAAQISQSLRDKVSSEQVASQYSVPLSDVSDVDDAQRVAMVDAYRMQGLVGGSILLVAAGIFGIHRREGNGVTAPPAAQRPTAAGAD